jgi:hypothetical protein
MLQWYQIIQGVVSLLKKVVLVNLYLAPEQRDWLDKQAEPLPPRPGRGKRSEWMRRHLEAMMKGEEKRI